MKPKGILPEESAAMLAGYAQHFRAERNTGEARAFRAGATALATNQQAIVNDLKTSGDQLFEARVRLRVYEEILDGTFDQQAAACLDAEVNRRRTEAERSEESSKPREEPGTV